MEAKRALPYAGVWMTPEVVGREDILEEIYQAIEGADTRVFYLTGPGGIGKTILLREVLARARPGGKWHRPGLLAMEDVVDFYHTTTHTSIGFARALSEALRQAAGEDLFPNYDRKHQDFEKKKCDIAGMLRELSTLRDEVLQTFLDDLNKLAEEHRLVLALDTAERLTYGEDPVQERLGWEPETVEVLPWLLKHFFPRLQNAVVLLAGRPAPLLEKDLERLPGLVKRELRPFNADETAAYFDAVKETARRQAEECRKEGREEDAAWLERFAARVEGIPAGVREVAWYYTEGKPIRLALLVDYLSNSEQLHPRVMEPLDAVKRRSKEEMEVARKEVEGDLVRFWQESPREADVAVEALAWARRGLDADLLACIAGVGKEEAERLLEQVRGLAFVKVRPADGRLFLHDEMYELLDRHLLQGRRPRQEQVYKAILEEYRSRILEQRRKVQQLWIPRREKAPEWEVGRVEVRAPDSPRRLAEATDRLYNLMAEEIYYRLRHNPVEGFRTWQLYVKEAFWASEENFDHLLRSEMLLFLKEREKEETIDGLHREEVVVAMALQRMERYNRQSDPRAVEGTRQMRESCADLLQAAGPLAPIRLDIVEGEALAYRGKGDDLKRAEGLLQNSVETLKAFSPASAQEEWWRSVYLAEAWNDLGYLYRTLGHFHWAEEAYRKAVDLWRRLEDEEEDGLRRVALRAQHANTLNNLSWALAELGRLRQATTVCTDALEMRQALGPRAPVAFSLNTLGLILIRDDKPHRARTHCSHALAIFRDLDQPRGVGLASLALAEALRRMSDVEHLYSPEEIAGFLRQAADHANDAVEIFEKVVPERPRLVEALIERGCVYRFWAWLRPKYEPAPEREDPDVGELFRRAEEDLRRAMDLAGEELPFRHLDAHVNLAWLYYYVARYGL
ncbi:MAG: tetratricopeptide repeat protein, partial [Candidatus Micrarchaeaceae archaeon]